MTNIHGKRPKGAIKRLLNLDKLSVILAAALMSSVALIISFLFYMRGNTSDQLIQEQIFYVITALFSIIFGITIFVHYFLKKISRLITLSSEEVEVLRLAEKELITEMEERQDFQKKVLESEERLKNILEIIPVGVIVCDREGRIRKMNQTASGIINYEYCETVGHSINEVIQLFNAVTQEKTNSVFSDLDTKFEVHQHFTKEHCLLNNREQKKIDIRYSLSPLIEHDETLNGFVFSFTDLSTQKKIESQLKVAHKMDAIAHLSGGISYEFNTVLNGVIGLTEIMKLKVSHDDPLQKYLDETLKICETAVEMTQHLISLANPAQKEFVNFDLSKVITEIPSIFEHSLATDTKLNLKLHEKKCYIHGNPGEIENAILNILVNAREAINKNGKISLFSGLTSKDTLTFCDAKADTYAMITIEDSGIGMSKEVINKLFIPFYSSGKDVSSMGLGLSAAYSTIRDHKGYIQVDSKQGEGSTFSIYLPVCKNIDNLMLNKDNGLHRGEGRILIVDDEEMLRKVTSDILQELGYTVLTAHDGRSAVNLLKDNLNFDLIVLDIHMPGLSAPQCISEFRAIKPQQKIIIGSGYAPGPEVNDCFDMGVQGFIRKPYEMSKISSQIKRAINMPLMALCSKN
ncbi:MAG: response regulator [Lentisphaeraceae bacterium]|nr:response regulator [Lentisphaeraceae bacterium]